MPPSRRIARDADVAIGTLYRHFPTRLDLLLAALEPRLQEFIDGSTTALEIDDPWDGFVSYLENLFRVQAGDRGFNDFLSRRFPGSADTERIHDEMCRQIEDVLTRAQDAGTGTPRHHPGRHRQPHLVQRPDDRRHQHHRARRVAASPPPHARRLPG